MKSKAQVVLWVVSIQGWVGLVLGVIRGDSVGDALGKTLVGTVLILATIGLLSLIWVATREDTAQNQHGPVSN